MCFFMFDLGLTFEVCQNKTKIEHFLAVYSARSLKYTAECQRNIFSIGSEYQLCFVRLIWELYSSAINTRNLIEFGFCERE